MSQPELARMTEGREMQFLIELRTQCMIAAELFERIKDHASECSEKRMKARGAGYASELELVMAIEAFLAAVARASLLVVPSDHGTSFAKVSRRRGKHLRRVLGITKAHAVANRELRDHWMHVDERIDSAHVALEDGREVDLLAIEHSSAFRFFEPAFTARAIQLDTLKVYIFGTEYDLSQLADAITDLHSRVGTGIDTSRARWAASHAALPLA